MDMLIYKDLALAVDTEECYWFSQEQQRYQTPPPLSNSSDFGLCQINYSGRQCFIAFSTQNNQMIQELFNPLFLILLLYWLVSLALFCFPQMLWKPKPFAHRPFNQLLTTSKLFCIGHRGGAIEGAENTIQAFTRSSKYTHMFEMDVMPTKDNQLVVHHDLTLKRTCGVNREVNELNYAELPRFRDEFPLHFGEEKGKGNNNPIPLLREVFQKFPEKVMNIELKNPTTEAALELNKLHYTVWGTARSSQILRKLNPKVEKFFNAKEILRIYLLYALGLLPFCPLMKGFVQIPMFTDEALHWIRRSRDDGSFKKKCIFCLVNCLGKFINCITGFLISHLKKRGIITFYFVLNNVQDYKSAVRKGCAGIMTDKPSELSLYLSAQSLLL